MPGPITTVREELAALLEADPSLAGFDVWPYPQDVDSPTDPTLVLATARVEPLPVGAGGLLVAVDVWVLSPVTDPAEAADPLEDSVALVLDALDAAGVEWTSAQPARWRDTHPAFLIETETRA